MSDYDFNPSDNHVLGRCRCILSAECLNAVRRSRMVPLDAIAKLSGLSREYLAGVERGEKDQCVDTRVILAYENAIGTPIEEEVLAVMSAYVQATAACLDNLTRMYFYRKRDIVAAQISSAVPQPRHN